MNTQQPISIKGNDTIRRRGLVGLAVVLLEEGATVEVVSRSHIY